MKRSIYYLMAVLLTASVCVGFTSCDDGDDDKDIKVKDKSQLTQTVSADDSSGQSEVSFTTTGPWSSIITETIDGKSSTPDWISISPDSGDEAGDYTIEIYLSYNYENTDRKAEIKLISGETTVTIKITQKASDDEGTGETLIDAGYFTLSDYYSGKRLGIVEVDKAVLLNGNQIIFYYEGNPVDIYLNMSSIKDGSFDWCESNCEGNYFYAQKGVTAGIMWYARKGEVRMNMGGSLCTIRVFIDANQDAYDNDEARLVIEGYYAGRLTTEDTHN